MMKYLCVIIPLEAHVRKISEILPRLTQKLKTTTVTHTNSLSRRNESRIGRVPDDNL